MKKETFPTFFLTVVHATHSPGKQVMGHAHHTAEHCDLSVLAGHALTYD